MLILLREYKQSFTLCQEKALLLDIKKIEKKGAKSPFLRLFNRVF